jgi:urea transporter
VWQQVGIAIAGGVLCNFYGVFLGKLLNRTFNVAPLTFPFNLTLIALMTAVRVTFPATDELSAHEGHAVEPPLDAEFFVLAALRGVAQVFVSSNEWVGLAMLFGVLVSSRFMALYFALGSIVGIAMGFALGREHTDIGAGTWGYNSVLAAGAVAFFFRLDSRSMLMPLFNAAFCALFYAALPRPSLTLAFCLGSAVVLTMQSSVPYLAAVPFFELSSPEQHREAQRKRDALEQP